MLEAVRFGPAKEFFYDFNSQTTISIIIEYTNGSVLKGFKARQMK